MSKIELRGISKRFNETNVLRDVSLEIEQGELCVFIGPSGCGKSTLLRLIAGLDGATAGDIHIDDQLVNELPPSQRNVAMVFQSYALYPHMSVFENMAFGLRHMGLPKPDIEARVAEAARMLHLGPLLERKPRELSGGQRQRVAIGRAIVRKAKVFLFDEPLSNLDAALRVKTRVEIANLHKSMPTVSMVYVTHDQVEAMTLADKIVLLRPEADSNGAPSIAQVGAPMTLYHRPANMFVAGFIGSPSMNFVPGTVSQLGERSVVATVRGAPMSAHVDAAALVGRELKVGASVTLGIRPEHIEIGFGPHAAKVTYLEQLGEHSYVYLQPGNNAEPFVAKTSDTTLRVGAEVPYDFPPEQVHMFLSDGAAVPRVQRAVLRAS